MGKLNNILDGKAAFLLRREKNVLKVKSEGIEIESAKEKTELGLLVGISLFIAIPGTIILALLL